MLLVPKTNSNYFSVKYSVIIGGKRYIPSVCYPVLPEIRAVVESMVGKGTARMYPEEVRFVSGVAYSMKQPEPAAAGTFPSALPAKPVSGGRTNKPIRPGRQPGRTSKDFE